MEKKILSIENVSKLYKKGSIGYGTLKRDVQSLWAKLRGKEDPNAKIGGKNNPNFLAVNGLNLDVYKGETVGIIGRNGAGKSTLLKLLSRITYPTEGKICINGKISSMLEVGTGFHPELTGRENVYLNGAILGMKEAEITQVLPDIIAFSECEEFIDTPAKRYSSGMLVRLAFSVAAHLNGDILLMDEVLAVGDKQFRDKCTKKIKSLVLDKGKTVIIVSHYMETIKELCTRCIVMEKGEKVFDGDVDSAIQKYTEICSLN